MRAITRERGKAQVLLAKIAKHRPARRFEVYALPNLRTGEIEGYQVAEIKRVGWWKASPLGASLAALKARQDEGRPMTASQAVLATVTLPLVQETPAYVGVEIAGRTAWFGRGTLVGLVVGGGQATITMARKALLKRVPQDLLGEAA
jgi:hypothetical protein